MTNSFVTAAKKESRKTLTENGAHAYASTGNALVDMFARIGSMRDAEPIDIETLMAEAFKQDPLLATKMMFYTRDIRGKRVGKGERDTFRILLKYMAYNHSDIVKLNIPLIGVYGRFDDLYVLAETPCADEMWQYMKELFNTDYSNMKYNKAHPDKTKKPVSLLAKWMKSVRTSSAESRRLGRMTASKIGLRQKNYKHAVSELRAYIPVLEAQMSANKWDEIDYERIPSKAMTTYRAAFARHDIHGKFEEYKEAVKKGEAKINASTLFPYDLVAPYIDSNMRKDDDIIEAQWKAMPDYVDDEVNALVICDTSGSMTTYVNDVYALPLKAAIGLALYFAEHNKGAFHNLFMTFSTYPEFVTVKGESLRQKIYNAKSARWNMSTNLQAAFELVLNTAVTHHIPQEEIPRALIVVSDMQINSCDATSDKDFYTAMREKFMHAGYEIPRIIFWNVNAQKATMLTDDTKRPGVQLISGLNAKTFSEIMDNVSTTAEDLMLACLNNERYEAVRIEAEK